MTKETVNPRAIKTPKDLDRFMLALLPP